MERSNIGLLLAGSETTYATDPTLSAAANIIACTRKGVAFAPKFTRISREILDGSYGQVSGYNTMGIADLSFDVELRGNRTDGSAADISAGAIGHLIEIDPLLLACDLAATYTPESTSGARDGKVIYNPAIPSDQGKSVTFYWYSGSKLHKIVGAKGTFKLSLNAGKIPVFSFKFQGLYVAVTDASIPGSQTWLNTKPPVFQSSTSVIDAYAPTFTKLDFDLGNTITQRDDGTAANGIKGFLITDRKSSLTIDPESVTEATKPLWANLAASTSATVSATVGSQAGNEAKLTCTGEPVDVSYSDDKGLRRQPIKFEINRPTIGTTPGSEIALQFN